MEGPGRSRARRWLGWAAAGVVALVGAGALGLWVASDPVPVGVVGPEADALARRLERAVDIDAWRRTGAVRWEFGGRRSHLWDRLRRRDRVTQGQREIIVSLAPAPGTFQGCARVGGQRLQGEALREALEDAWRMWVNDAFWLNPLDKSFDPGVERALVQEQGQPALRVTFSQGGATPGDSYLWLPGPDGRPRAWRMWTKIPVGGLRASWDGWVRLATGAWVATEHEMAGFTLRLSDVEGARDLASLLDGAPDPFAWCAL